ncbi:MULTISPECIES: DUF58 domain-containing protein [Ensifer]|jgi:uncharacterized protein (DUF58 family)|uniref:DUF58 domain-containing protein n=1 Tax=Ensifer canadensis TaxID=555315 RepID=A0AAW4FSX0_9HYPH|nr:MULTISPECIES: DUF58 domain-containing protein [Ensifer]MDP9630232.1 uncharacterized protein (DUF58 family) [Ensifer adhaerens]KQU85812.1 hypothetical protein ASD00_31960 [Ensifer sp. Root31]KQW53972.1 hypothetical protein ASD02_31440 [Ensifer sp. Root1252]KQW83331.1 hypothetical protein ASD03_21835 [Ensifer sp. Root127]KQY68842.1 hypothetical protein ASD52_33165 [Ensifer sp. Root142]
MASIGHIVARTPAGEVLSRAQQRAMLVPDCLVEARRIANTVISGWHGRRKRGIGENFWQFRPYSDGESLSRIDWRRSARDDHTYVRDREWEAAHTIWLWADLSPSMMYKSTLGSVSKESRALVLMLALAEILARSGERIGCPGVMEPISARNAAERLATAIMLSPLSEGLPETGMIRSASDLVLIGDFLDPTDRIMERLGPLARRGLRGHVVEVADPAEEVFPYAGRTEFSDPETGQKLTAGRAEVLREDYQRAYLARRESLGVTLRHLGWTFTPHRTDRPASEALVAVHMYLSGMPGRATHGGQL